MSEKEIPALKNFYDSHLYHFLSTVTVLMKLNILTVLCSLPVLTAGASVTALYAVLESLTENRGGSVSREFFTSWKKYFQKATLFWLTLLAVVILVVGNLFIVYQGAVAGNAFFFLCAANLVLMVTVLTASMLFPFLPVFKAGFLKTIQISLVYALRYLPKTILMTALNVFPFVLAYYHTEMFVRFFPFWLLLGFSAIAYCNAVLVHPVILSIQEELEKQSEN